MTDVTAKTVTPDGPNSLLEYPFNWLYWKCEWVVLHEAKYPAVFPTAYDARDSRLNQNGGSGASVSGTACYIGYREASRSPDDHDVQYLIMHIEWVAACQLPSPGEWRVFTDGPMDSCFSLREEVPAHQVVGPEVPSWRSWVVETDEDAGFAFDLTQYLAFDEDVLAHLASLARILPEREQITAG